MKLTLYRRESLVERLYRGDIQLYLGDAFEIRGRITAVSFKPAKLHYIREDRYQLIESFRYFGAFQHITEDLKTISDNVGIRGEVFIKITVFEAEHLKQTELLQDEHIYVRRVKSVIVTAL